MFHVEQFDFDRPFHVERKHAKTILNSGFLLDFGGKKIIFDLCPSDFL